ncbi:hypothetical protein ABT341_00410 [Pseudonocardia alni]|uniref:hypothetical protein n=1 Tax=Pseudonocardia alni TaxID=33907 RepID=UPI00332F04D7
MTEPLNPVQIEASIRETANDIARGVHVVSNAEAQYREKTRLYDRAFAAAYLAAEGPQYEKRYRAELATERERDDMEVAELAFKHAERTARSLEAKLRAFQSVGASVRQMYGAVS